MLRIYLGELDTNIKRRSFWHSICVCFSVADGSCHCKAHIQSFWSSELVMRCHHNAWPSWLEKLTNKLFQVSLDWIFMAFATLTVTGVQRLFMWARSTGLARFPRSRLATLFFGKNSISSNVKLGCPGYRNLGNGDENFTIWTLQSAGDQDETFFWQNSFAIAA